MLGTMLRYQTGFNQQDVLSKLTARDKAIQERRDRMKEYEDKKTNSRENNDGVLHTILGMSPASVMFIGSINKLIETFESSDIKTQDQATKFLSKFDKQASKEDVETILDLMVEQMMERESEFKKFKFDLETYEFYNKEYEFKQQEEIQAQVVKTSIIEKEKEIQKIEDQEDSLIESINRS